MIEHAKTDGAQWWTVRLQRTGKRGVTISFFVHKQLDGPLSLEFFFRIWKPGWRKSVFKSRRYGR